MKIEINPLHLTCCVHHAELMANHGMSLTRVAPTLREMRDIYALDAYCTQEGYPAPTTWKKAAPVLREIKTLVDAQMDEMRAAAA